MRIRPRHHDLTLQPIKQASMRSLLPLKHVVERLAGKPTRHCISCGTAQSFIFFIAESSRRRLTYHFVWLFRTAQSYSFQTSLLRTRRFLIMVCASLIKLSIVSVRVLVLASLIEFGSKFTPQSTWPATWLHSQFENMGYSNMTILKRVVFTCYNHFGTNKLKRTPAFLRSSLAVNGRWTYL
jgi:hypothetical protein